MLPLRDGYLAIQTWGMVTGLRYQRQGLLASNQLLNMQKGTRLNALLLMRGAPSLLNNADQSHSLLLPSETSESLPSELFELDSDVFV